MQKWTTPKDWFGTPHEGMFVLGEVMRHRDSSILADSNFAAAVERLKVVAEEGSETWYVVREGHFAVGWIEWIAINPDNNVVWAEARAIEKDMSNYPVLNESDYYQREDQAANAYWDDPFNRRYCMKLLVGCGCSHLAVRRPLYEQLDEIRKCIETIVNE